MRRFVRAYLEIVNIRERETLTDSTYEANVRCFQYKRVLKRGSGKPANNQNNQNNQLKENENEINKPFDFGFRFFVVVEERDRERFRTREKKR